jgi:wobble nucleotide-excising tRNase
MEETIAKQAKSIDDLRKAMEEAESLRRKNEQRLREEASLKQ